MMEYELQLQLGQKLSRISLSRYFSLLAPLLLKLYRLMQGFFSLALSVLFSCVESNKSALASATKSLQWKFMQPIPRALFPALLQLLVLSTVTMLLDV